MASLVVLVLHDVERFCDVMDAWREVGGVAATVLDSLGTHSFSERLCEDDIPLVPSLRHLLSGKEVPRKTIFSVIEEQKIVDSVVEATQRVLGDLSQPGKGILFVVPVSQVFGLRTGQLDDN